MSERILRFALAALSLAGVAVTGYLLSVRWSSVELLCSTGGCESVQSSKYAEVLGIPVAAAGLGGYVLLGATALSVAPLARALGAGLALAALAFSGYLLVIQLAVIGDTCDWCFASDAIVTLATAVALLRLRYELSSNPAARA